MNNRVLIVEDCHIQSTVVKKMLESEGFVVTDVCRSSEQALASVKIEQPDIILMDIYIEGEVNGIDTIKIIRESYPIPVIFITALTRSELREEASAMKATHILAKPISKEELVSTIHNLLNLVVEA